MLEHGQAAETGAVSARNDGSRPFAQLVRLMVTVALTGALLAAVLALVTPQFGSQVRLMIERADVAPAGMDGERRAPDALTLASQIEVLRSLDLAARVAERNELAKDPEFNETLAALSPLKQLAIMTDTIPDPASLPERERVIRSLTDRLSVELVPDTGLVAVNFRSNDADKSARIANDLAGAYVEWLASSMRPADAPALALGNEIADLRARIDERAAKLAELLAVQRERAVQGTGAVDAGKLFDLQSQLILARAKREEVEGRAAQVRQMLASGGELQRTGELFNTGLIQRLLDRQSALQRKVSEAEATLLPSHPQMKRLNGELAGLQAQIRSEAEGVAVGLDADAAVALSREKALQHSIDELRGVTPQAAAPAVSSSQIDEVREALANDRRRLAQSEARLDVANIVHTGDPGALRASIVARAQSDHVPVFPKKAPVILGGMALVLFVGLVQLWLQLAFGWPRVERRRADRRAGARPGDEAVPPIKRPDLLNPVGGNAKTARG
jgi:uncharacterized protein involved in exopolysaccharide biosynthesis